MNRIAIPGRPLFRAGLMLLMLVAASAPVLAQDEDPASGSDELQDTIDFEVQMFRVDLYRDRSGDEVERLVEVSDAVRGQEIEYQVVATNDGDRIYRPYEFSATMQIPDGLEYLEASAEDPDAPFVVEYSSDGGDTFVAAGEGDVEPDEVDVIQWIYEERFEPGDRITFSYRVTVR